MAASTSSESENALRRVAAGQAGVVHRRQALRAGVTSSAIGRLTSAGRWRTLHPGVYAVHDQPVDDLARVWAAVLYVGRGGAVAVASGTTALWLAGILDGCPAVVEVTTTAARRVRRQPGVRVRVRETVSAHPSLRPPRQRLEEALLDVLGDTAHAERVIDLVLRAGQRRLTTPARLRAAAAVRSRLRWRWLLEALCADLASGVHSVLERVYRRDVERAHGLPRGTRNRAEPGASSSWYRDVRYRAWLVLVELDGRGAHPVEEAFRDRRRDNWAARAGEVSLRTGGGRWCRRPARSPPRSRRCCAATAGVDACDRAGPGAPRPRRRAKTCSRPAGGSLRPEDADTWAQEGVVRADERH